MRQYLFSRYLLKLFKIATYLATGKQRQTLSYSACAANIVHLRWSDQYYGPFAVSNPQYTNKWNKYRSTFKSRIQQRTQKLRKFEALGWFSRTNTALNTPLAPFFQLLILHWQRLSPTIWYERESRWATILRNSDKFDLGPGQTSKFTWDEIKCNLGRPKWVTLDRWVKRRMQFVEPNSKQQKWILQAAGFIQ